MNIHVIKYILFTTSINKKLFEKNILNVIERFIFDDTKFTKTEYDTITVFISNVIKFMKNYKFDKNKCVSASISNFKYKNQRLKDILKLPQYRSIFIDTELIKFICDIFYDKYKLLLFVYRVYYGKTPTNFCDVSISNTRENIRNILNIKYLSYTNG